MKTIWTTTPTAFLAVVVITLLFAVGATGASTPAVQKILPAKDSVKGFGIVAGSLQYAKGADLTKIYNGAVDLYTGNGVLAAARQLYQRKNDYVEVTVHEMKSEKAALDFLNYWKKEHGVKSLTKTKTSSSFIVTKPSCMGYTVVGKYFATVSALYSSDSAKNDVKSFMKVVEKKTIDLTKESSR